MSDDTAAPFIFAEAFGGRLMEEIEDRIQEAMADLENPRKKPDAERVVTVELGIKPASDGRAVRIRGEVNCKLAKNAKLTAVGLVGADATLLEFPQPRPGRVLQMTIADAEKAEGE